MSLPTHSLAFRLATLLAAAACLGTAPARAQSSRGDSKTAPVAVALERLKEGQALFERDWVKQESLAIGPVFNAASCIACHKSGSPGGAAGNDLNVDLLSLEASAPARSPDSFTDRARRVHPGLAAQQTTVIVHRSQLAKDNPKFGLDERYETWRKELLAKVAPKGGSHVGIARGVVAGMRVRLSQRSTPALFGAGLIDVIPDHVIVAVADQQKEQHPEVQGRVPRDASGRVGRFGWRGQVNHLHDFVLGACANELGLSVPGHAPPERIRFDEKGFASIANRDNNGLISGPGRRTPPLELTSEQCLSLTAFVGALLPPTRSSSASVAHARDITAGETLFAEVGCAQCHMPEVGGLKGVYSDLLLHDMGTELGDPVGANPETGSFGSAGYYGSVAPTPIASAKPSTNLQQEWRTPPLWGVSDSAPYLHDGRAMTLEDAIRQHGGQGRRSARQFAALAKPDRNRLLEFLASLAAPRADGTVPAATVVTPGTGSPFGFGSGFSGGAGGFFQLKD